MAKNTRSYSLDDTVIERLVKEAAKEKRKLSEWLNMILKNRYNLK